jgi:hypothetical protein
MQKLQHENSFIENQSPSIQPTRRVKIDEENQLSPPTTIEELWVRMNIMERKLKR